VLGPPDLTREEFARWWRDTGEDELRQILYWRWDPIGVSDSFPVAVDEYDNYGPGVVALLRGGASEEDMADHLGFVARETIGMPNDDPEARAEAAALLATWFSNSVAQWQWRESGAPE
jgi:hypothetical protein